VEGHARRRGGREDGGEKGGGRSRKGAGGEGGEVVENGREAQRGACPGEGEEEGGGGPLLSEDQESARLPREGDSSLRPSLDRGELSVLSLGCPL
jgi:hypothetical protein